MTGGRDPLRLAIGTLTAVRVGPPARVDRGVAGGAMALAPAVGAALGLGAGLVTVLVGLLGGGPLLAAALAVTALAALTRGMHLDGLADTADGLGSGLPPAGALEVMRRSDVGPFGVATLVLTLMVQVAALATCLAELRAGAAVGVLVAAGAVSRFALVLACRPGAPSARATGLGATVAGSVTPSRFAEGLGIGSAALAVASAAGGWPAWLTVLGLLPAHGLLTRCRDRLGGVTGDVLGATVEVAFTGALVAAALAA